ncbi:hypothetical protein TRFO_09941 [Tritrichomonas foetus]|uniref:Uncharacterized protein n=1 Tax=Tritrichomonas foetus TaxID=1144522 RepID=A0A1J4JBI2_9EUKA|nr:hypothetical protein TRFO_09941 [Tritrichomonas foetus]|eukprot:OHS96542.1 hypothetical protein TRFO_09941 [Tritrichomonas foetus]
MEQANSIEFLQKRSESADIRAQKAFDLYTNNQISADTLLKWIMKELSRDDKIKNSRIVWDLFLRLLKDGNFRSDRFSIYLNRKDILNLYFSDFHELVFETLAYIIANYPNAWRPNFVDLMTLISQMLEKEIHSNEVSLIMNILLNQPEIIAANDLVFTKMKEILFKPLLEHAKEIDTELAFTVLANTLCVPFFVRKVLSETGKFTNQNNQSKNNKKQNNKDENDNHHNNSSNQQSKISKEVIDILNQSKNSPLFVPFMIRAIHKQAKLLNIQMNLSFPLEIIENSPSLDIAVPLIKESRELRIYVVEVDSKYTKPLSNLAQRAIKEKHSSLLVELAMLDFQIIKPNIRNILLSHEISTPELLLAILRQCLLLRDLTILFEGGVFPAHILSCKEFIDQFCDGVKHMVSNQLKNLIDLLLCFSNKIEESALLFWAIKAGRLTEEFIDLTDRLLNDCFSNPWRFAAAVIAAKTLQRQMPPPLPIVSDITTHPVILECFLYENYGNISIASSQPTNGKLLPNKSLVVPSIPAPLMESPEVYRICFIIQNLPFLAPCLQKEDLIFLLQYIFKKSLYAQNLENPTIIADYCLALLHNTMFYESWEIRSVFTEAILPLLPKGHMKVQQQITPKLQMRCAIISSMPSEFLSVQLSTAAFVGLFISSEGQPTMQLMAHTNELFSNMNVSLVDCICNCAENISKTSIKHNIDRIFSNCSDDSIEKLIPILLEKLENTFPSAPITKPLQLVALCEFCYEKKIPLPFEETLFENDLHSFCSQLRIGHQNTFSLLLESTISPQDAPFIVTALNDYGNLNLNSQSNNQSHNSSGSFNNLPDAFLKHLIEILAQNDNVFDTKVISQFSSKLSTKLILHFLEVAPLIYYPHIFAQLSMKKDEFAPFGKYIKKILSSSPPIPVIKSLCSIRISHNYDTDIVTKLLLLIADETNKTQNVQNIQNVCLLCNCMVQLINNCNKELSRQTTYVIEIVRKLSSIFAKSISLENPSYRHLKQLAKLFSAVAKATYTDHLQYLIASFVSHITLYQPREEEQLKMKSLQTAVFPLFTRCTKDQLNEVSTALHDSHREIFKQLSERWTNEAQFRGKV